MVQKPASSEPSNATFLVAVADAENSGRLPVVLASRYSLAVHDFTPCEVRHYVAYSHVLMFTRL